jgi:hypothetical protein
MKKSVWSIVTLSFLGTLFAGYLTYDKIFSGQCTLAEGCSYFVGLPTCLFGLLFYLAIFIVSIIALFRKTHYKKTISIISFLAVIFSGYFSIYELFFAKPNILTGAVFTLGLPSCVYGFVVLLIIFIVALKTNKK